MRRRTPENFNFKLYLAIVSEVRLQLAMKKYEKPNGVQTIVRVQTPLLVEWFLEMVCT